MKIYRLKSWPDLPPAFRRIAYRRLICDLSHRHVSELEMREHSGLSAPEVRGLLAHLDTEGLLDARDAPDPVPTRGALWRLTGPLHALLRR